MYQLRSLSLLRRSSLSRALPPHAAPARDHPPYKAALDRSLSGGAQGVRGRMDRKGPMEGPGSATVGNN